MLPRWVIRVQLDDHERCCDVWAAVSDRRCPRCKCRVSSQVGLTHRLQIGEHQFGGGDAVRDRHQGGLIKWQPGHEAPVVLRAQACEVVHAAARHASLVREPLSRCWTSASRKAPADESQRLHVGEPRGMAGGVSHSENQVVASKRVKDAHGGAQQAVAWRGFTIAVERGVDPIEGGDPHLSPTIGPCRVTLHGKRAGSRKRIAPYAPFGQRARQEHEPLTLSSHCLWSSE